jgi:hypothetical protein
MHQVLRVNAIAGIVLLLGPLESAKHKHKINLWTKATTQRLSKRLKIRHGEFSSWQFNTSYKYAMIVT